MKKLFITISAAFVIIMFGVFLLHLDQSANTPGALAKITAEVVEVEVVKNDNQEISYSYPVFSGIADANVREKINADIKSRMAEGAEGSRVDAAEICPEGQEADESGWQCHFAYDGEYKASTRLSDRILSVRLETYMYTGGAHGDTGVEFVNYDLRTGERFVWQSVFAADSDYLGAIAKYANADIKKQLLIGEDSMSQEDWIDQGSSATEGNYADGNVGFDENGLIVVFQEYQVAAYAQGAVISLIPYGELEGVIDGNGLLRK